MTWQTPCEMSLIYFASSLAVHFGLEIGVWIQQHRWFTRHQKETASAHQSRFHCEILGHLAWQEGLRGSWLTERSVTLFVADFSKIQKNQWPRKRHFWGSCPGPGLVLPPTELGQRCWQRGIFSLTLAKDYGIVLQQSLKLWAYWWSLWSCGHTGGEPVKEYSGPGQEHLHYSAVGEVDNG